MKYKNEIRKILFKTINFTESKRKITNETNLQDVGMDSLTFIRSIVEMESFFKIEFPDEKLVISELNTIKKFCEIVAVLKLEENSYK